MENQEIRDLEPKDIWNYFVYLNAVPRPSKKEERVRQFIKDFGKYLNLETREDAVGNIVIAKPSTYGYENKKKVVLQAHLDMVAQKDNEIEFDFDTQGIQMEVKGDWVQAKGTTLGADNGIGVAAIMSVLASATLEHPSIEALFTVDEETGMTGAFGLEKDFISGDILLNLDTEEDNEISIGCAGGMDITASITYKETELPENYISYKIELKGLHGGHSGMDIHKGLGNSNKLINRFLYSFLEIRVRLTSFDGGGLRNVIPREATVIFSIPKDKEEDMNILFTILKKEILEEFITIEENLNIKIYPIEKQIESLSTIDSKKFISVIQSAHNGVFRMSLDMGDLVEASNNIARIELEKGKAEIMCLARSSVESTKLWVTQSLKSVFELADMQVEFAGSYPGWKPNLNSEILKTAKEVYKNKYGEEPLVLAGHGGLECGIIGEKYPEMEMISFGPTIKGAHSPKEKVSISSVQKFWNYLQEILKHIPNKN